MFCSSCGAKIGENEKFCKECGTPVTQQSAPQAPAAAPDKKPNKKKGNILAIISLALLLGTSAIVIPLAVTRVLDDYPLIGIAVAFVYLVAVFAAYILMIISAAKYRSTLSKVMIWIYIAVFVITLILGILFIISVMYDCGNDVANFFHHF